MIMTDDKINELKEKARVGTITPEERVALLEALEQHLEDLVPPRYKKIEKAVTKE